MAMEHVVLGRSLATAMVLLLLVAPTQAYGRDLRPGSHLSGEVTALLPASRESVRQGPCAPRPRITVQSEKTGEKDFRVTVRAGQGNVELLRFGNAPNARVDLPGQQPGATPPFDYKPPNATNFTFVVHSTGVGAPVTVPLTIYDGCGESHPWNTFVGGGQAATQVEISIADASLVEGNSGSQGMTFVISLSSAASVPVTVGWSTLTNASATNQDFVSASGVATFTPGETQKSIVVQVVGDLVDEPNKTFTVRLANATNGTIEDGTATGTIIDNEGAPSLSVNDVSTAEENAGTTPLQFTVALTSPSGLPVTVQYATAPDTATAADFTATSGSLSFAPGETTKTVTVQVTGERLFEPNERFFLNLASPTNATIGKPQGIGTISNDDAVPTVAFAIAPATFAENGGTATVTATLSNPTTQPVTVALAFAGSATFPGDYSRTGAQIQMAPGSTSGAITLTAIDDTFFEGPETVEVAIDAVTNAVEQTPQIVSATISENEGAPTVSLGLSAASFAENLGTTTVTATLSGPVDEPVTVTLTIGGSGAGLADFPADYQRSSTTIQIAPMQLTGSVTLTAVNDTVPEGDETIPVSIASASGGGVTIGSPSQVTATIVDDDAPSVTLSVDAPTTFGENGGTATVRATLSRAPLGSATINLNFAGTATRGPGTDTDYTASATQIVIAAPATSGTVTLTGLQDDIYEGTTPETVVVTLGTLTGAVDPAPAESVTATIADDDAQPTVSLSIASSPFPEAGSAPATVTATLNRRSTSPVTVNLGFDFAVANPASAGDFQASAAQIAIAFPSTTGSITLTGIPDATTEGTENFNVTIGSATGATPTAPTSVAAQIADDDAPPVIDTSAGPAAFTEGTGPAVVDSALSLTDADSTTLVSATVRIGDGATVPDGAAEGLDVDLTSPTVLSGISKAGAGTATLTLTQSSPGSASLANVRSALQRVTYNNTSQNPTTTARVITFAANDGTNTGSDTRSLAVTATNDAPVNAVPAAQFVADTGTLAFSVANGNAISVTDVDLASSSISVTVSVPATKGTLTEAASSGAGVAGSGTNSLTLTGTLPQVNAALNGLVYDPPNGSNDTIVLTVLANDNGNTGTPGALTDSDTVTVHVDRAPAVETTTPVNGATAVAVDTNIVVNFSETVTIAAGAFTIQCPVPTAIAFTISPAVPGNVSSYTLDPTTDLPNDATCTVTVVASAISDTDANDPPDAMAANHTFTFDTPPPDVAPAVQLPISPANGAANVAVNANVVVAFSEDVTLDANAFTLTCTTPQAITVTGSGTSTITLNPDADLPEGTLCTIAMDRTKVHDEDLNDPPDTPTSDLSSTFTTDAGPTVTGTTPASGATAAIDTNVTLDFSEAVTFDAGAFLLQCPTAGASQALTPSGSGTAQIVLDPTANLPAGVSCTLTVDRTKLHDADSGDPPDTLPSDYTLAFSTDAGPSVSSTTPTDDATQVASNTDLTVTFSEAVDVSGAWFTISCATSGAHTATVSGGPTTFTLDPDTDFTFGELCTLTVVAAQVTDQDAFDPPNELAANYVFDFTIDAQPTLTLPTSPANGSIDNLKTTNVVLTFSESVTFDAGAFTIACPTGSPQAFTPSGSGTSTITLNPDADLPPGVVCTVSIDRTKIHDVDAGDPPDNLPADHAFTFGVKPEAGADARNATGNVRIATAGRSNFTVLTNDLPAGIPLTASDTSSARGGTVAVATDGTFTYNPPVGYEGTDTFTYTISNTAGSDTGTVTITIAGMLWFIDDSATACTSITTVDGCGRLTSPLSTLAAFEGANGAATPTNGADVIAPEAGDHIFVSSGSYTAPLTLENNQRVIGQGAVASLQTLSGITPATDSDTLPTTGGTRPSIASAGNGINVVSGNQLHGLAFSNTGGTAISSSASVGTMLLTDVVIDNSGSAGAGIVLGDGGTFVTATGTNTIVTRSATALNITNTPIGTAGLTFQSISAGNNNANADPTSGIILNNTGTTAGTHGGLSVTGTGGANSGGTIQNATGDAIVLTTTRGVSLTDMSLTSAGQSWIDATSVTGLTLTRISADLSFDHGILGSTVRDLTIVGGTYDRGGFRDGTNAVCNLNGLSFTNLLGTSSVTDATFRRSNTIQFRANNNTATSFSGTPDSLTVSGTTWNTHNHPCAGDHLSVNADTGGNFSLIVNSTSGVNTVNEGGAAPTGGGIGVQATAGGTNGKMTASVTGLKTTNNTSGVVIGNPGSGSTVSFNISGNKTGNGSGFTSTGSVAISVSQVSSGATTSGIIDDNSISHAAGPGTNALQVLLEGGGTVTTRVSNNVISGNYQRGIHAQAHLGTGTMNLTVNNNALTGTDTTNTALQQVNVVTGGSGSGHSNTMCLNMLANNVSLGGGATYLAAYRLDNDSGGTTTTFRLQNFVGNGANTADVQTWVTTTKSNVGTPVSVSMGPAYTVAPANCATP